MIINWKKPKAGILVIPCINPKTGVHEKYLTLLPGHNEVSTEDWEQAEGHCQDHIKNDFMEVVTEKVEKEIKVIKKVQVKNDKTGKMEDKDTEVKETIVENKPASSLKKLKPNKARKIVQETYNLETLQAWREIESRDEIRAVISNQIDSIENFKGNK